MEDKKMNQQAIAMHLSVSVDRIIKIEEWAHVFFAVVKGIGARFISKKIVKESAVRITVRDTGHKSPGFRKAWVAKLTGSNPQYGFDRIFLNTFEQEGRAKTFKITEAGVYQSKTYSSSGNATVEFWKFVAGGIEGITEDEAKEIIGYQQPQKREIIDLSQFSCDFCGVREGFVKQRGRVLCCDCCD